MSRIRGAVHFNRKQFQIQKQTHFYVSFSGNFVDPRLSYLVLSVQLPNETTEVTKEPFFNQQVNIAGFTTFEDCNLVIRDVIGIDAESIFQKWRHKVYDAADATMGGPEDYKAEGTLTLTDPKGANTRPWRLVGCFPRTVNYGEMQYGSSEDVRISVGMTYDWGYRLKKVQGEETVVQLPENEY